MRGRRLRPVAITVSPSGTAAPLLGAERSFPAHAACYFQISEIHGSRRQSSPMPYLTTQVLQMALLRPVRVLRSRFRDNRGDTASIKAWPARGSGARRGLGPAALRHALERSHAGTLATHETSLTTQVPHVPPMIPSRASHPATRQSPRPHNAAGRGPWPSDKGFIRGYSTSRR